MQPKATDPLNSPTAAQDPQRKQLDRSTQQSESWNIFDGLRVLESWKNRCGPKILNCLSQKPKGGHWPRQAHSKQLVYALLVYPENLTPQEMTKWWL